MKVTHYMDITREDGTEYFKFFLVNGYTLTLDCNSKEWQLFGKSGRKINNENSKHEAVKAVNTYYDEQE